MQDLESLRREIALLGSDERIALARWLVDTLPAGITLLSERATLVDLELQHETLAYPPPIDLKSAAR